jgi:hypothetical protein
MEKRLHDMSARLKELNYNVPANEAEIRHLEWKRDDLRDELGLALLRTGSDPDANRQELLRDANFERAAFNNSKAQSRSAGIRDDSKARKPYAELELEALDIVQGRKAIPTPKRQSSDDRAAELHNFDARDREALARIRGTISEAEAAASMPNAESVLQESTEQGST